MPALETSEAMHGDDYVLNTKVNYGLVSNAISHSRFAGFCSLLGMRAPSTTDHYRFKAEVEPIWAQQAERSMAEAHERNVARGDSDYISVDAGYTSPRNAKGCTMTGHAADTAIVAVVHKRLTDPGATHSKAPPPARPAPHDCRCPPH